MSHKPYGPYEKYFKRPIDLFCGLAAVIVFSWLYIIVAVLVRVKLGSPVLFKQPRPGKIDPRTGQEREYINYTYMETAKESVPPANWQKAVK